MPRATTAISSCSASSKREKRRRIEPAALEDSGFAWVELAQRQNAIDRLNEAFDLYSTHGAVASARRVSRRLQLLGVSRRVVRPRLSAGWEMYSRSAARPWPIIRGRIAQAPMSQPPRPTRLNRNATFAAANVPDRAKLPIRERPYKSAPRWGHVAEWLRSGLQNRLHQFNSGRGLHFNYLKVLRILGRALFRRGTLW